MLTPLPLLGFDTPEDMPLHDVLGKKVLKRPCFFFLCMSAKLATSKLILLVLHLKGKMGLFLKLSLQVSFIHPNLGRGKLST